MKHSELKEIIKDIRPACDNYHYDIHNFGESNPNLRDTLDDAEKKALDVADRTTKMLELAIQWIKGYEKNLETYHDRARTEEQIACDLFAQYQKQIKMGNNGV